MMGNGKSGQPQSLGYRQGLLVWFIRSNPLRSGSLQALAPVGSHRDQSVVKGEAGRPVLL